MCSRQEVDQRAGLGFGAAEHATGNPSRLLFRRRVAHQMLQRSGNLVGTGVCCDVAACFRDGAFDTCQQVGEVLLGIGFAMIAWVQSPHFAAYSLRGAGGTATEGCSARHRRVWPGLGSDG